MNLDRLYDGGDEDRDYRVFTLAVLERAGQIHREVRDASA